MYTIVYSALGANVFSGRGTFGNIWEVQGHKEQLRRRQGVGNEKRGKSSVGKSLCRDVSHQISYYSETCITVSGPQLSGHSFY